MFATALCTFVIHYGIVYGILRVLQHYIVIVLNGYTITLWGYYIVTLLRWFVVNTGSNSRKLKIVVQPKYNSKYWCKCIRYQGPSLWNRVDNKFKLTAIFNEWSLGCTCSFCVLHCIVLYPTLNKFLLKTRSHSTPRSKIYGNRVDVVERGNFGRGYIYISCDTSVVTVVLNPIGYMYVGLCLVEAMTLSMRSSISVIHVCTHTSNFTQRDIRGHLHVR